LFWDELGYRAVLWNGDHHHGGPHALPTSGWSVFRSHLGTAGSPLLEPVRTTDAPRHYFLGKDASRWRSNVAEWTAFLHKDLYPGIDAWIRDSTGDLAVDYRIAPGVDPSVIRWHYPGASRIELDADGNARIETPAGILWETAPRAYQQTPDGEREVRVRFRLTETESGTALSFDLGKYDKKMPLVVDPKLVFASFSGSTSDNWGYTATYDDQGNLYGGGIVFSPGYPTTPGAFDPTYSQGLNTTTDVGITKFSSNGSQRLFSTYLGGNNSDQPHSMIVANNELIVYGITSSTNFPITINAAQSNFVGGPSYPGPKHSFTNGTDLFITRLNATGSALIGSTYFHTTSAQPGGGGVNEGLSSISQNYGDAFRGEVNLTSNGDIVVATSVTNATEDALLVRFSPTLNQIRWSTQLQGNNVDAAYAVRVDPNDKIFITGGTRSNNLPTTPGVVQGNLLGGLDGYIARYSGNGVLEACTYLGTPSNDQSFCLDIDKFGSVYVFGQTRGTWPVVNAAWNTSAGSQFIHKLAPDLQSTLMSTKFGTGNQINIVPTALEVDDCLNIFISGWGGSANRRFGNQGGNTFGLPISANAIQPNTDGSDFYFLVLSRNSSALKYATFFGGLGEDHVDGGTSRFSKSGTIYQAVCAACASGTFPTTPGVVSPTNPSNNCNLGVIKFDFETIVTAKSEIDFDRDVDTLCETLRINFSNQSINANAYFWDFGNGQTSTLATPTAQFNIGSYRIVLTAYDTICDISDTVYINLNFNEGALPVSTFEVDYVECDRTFEVRTSNLSQKSNGYFWDFGDGQQSTLFEPVHQYSAPGTYRIRLRALDTTCGKWDTSSVSVKFGNDKPGPNITLAPDTCFDGRIRLNIDYGGDTATKYLYRWTFPNGIVDTGRVTVYQLPASGTYIIQLEAVDLICNSVFTYEFTTALLRINQRVFIPNAFTPNGDNVNEFFEIKGNNCGLISNTLVVLNSFGNVVFETDKPFGDYWDGTIAGKPAQSDTYTYRLVHEDGVFTGYVTLIR
jgi:gliding motility-associated-like protein